MYSVYINNGLGEQLVYSPIDAADGYVILSPILKKELNKADTFSFILPPTNPNAGSILKLTTIITVYDNDDLVFRGRCRESNMPFDTLVKYECEGDLAFLSDFDFPAYNTGETKTSKTIAEWISYFLDAYNGQSGMSESRKLYAGNISSTSETYALYNDSDTNALDEIINIAEALGGMIKTRTENGTTYLDYVPTGVHLPSQIIEFGTNLLDLEEKIDATQIVTRAKLYGKDRRTINDVINTASEALYGTIIRRIYSYPEVTTDAELTRLGRLIVGLPDSGTATAQPMIGTINLSAVDMHLLNADVAAYRLGYSYRMVSTAHGIDDWFSCNRIELDLQDPTKNKYSFGRVRRTLTDQNAISTPIIRRF